MIALTPFHATASGSFWTTNSARNVSAFGYTYPEFVNGSSTAKIRSIVNQLYGPSATGIAGSVKRDLTSTGLATPNQGLTWPLAGGNVEYVANVVLERWALNGSYTIYFFMGKPREENAHAYPFANNLIGSFAVFANPGMGMNHILSAGSVPLTRALRSQIGGGLLQSLSRLLVVPFLQAALEWRVATTNGQIIPNDLVPGLEVSVVTADYTPPSSANAFPIYRSFNTLPDITDRKAGGLRFNMRPACER